MTKPLSPSAQAVWQQYCGIVEGHGPARLGVAAALRAAADQVVPTTVEQEFYDRNPSLTLQKAVEIRAELLAIAAELEGGND